MTADTSKSPEAAGSNPAEESLRARTESYFSEPLEFASGQPVAISQIDVAAYVNACSRHTHFHIEKEDMDAFNATWRRQLREVFASEHATSELDEWEATGLSCGRPLRLQIMALKPDLWFRVHGHPNFEFEHTLAGTLREVRYKEVVQLDSFTAKEDGSLEGPNLGQMVASKRVSVDMAGEFEPCEVPKGGFLANTVGSIHQSYTADDGALILVLWSGCHANIRPENCAGLGNVLRPKAGWACCCEE